MCEWTCVPVSPFLCPARGSMANVDHSDSASQIFWLYTSPHQSWLKGQHSFPDLSLLCSCFINHQHYPKHFKTLQISSESTPRQSVFFPFQYCVHSFLLSSPLPSSPKPTSLPLKHSPQNFPITSFPYQIYSYLRDVSCLLLEYWDLASEFLCLLFLLLATYLAILFC